MQNALRIECSHPVATALGSVTGDARFASWSCLQTSLENAMKITTALFLLLAVVIACLAQTPPSDRQQFIRVEAPVIALTHVRVIDGTGAGPLDDQTIPIANSKIQTLEPTPTPTPPTDPPPLA